MDIAKLYQTLTGEPWPHGPVAGPATLSPTALPKLKPAALPRLSRRGRQLERPRP
jgi:hypothetical protein